MTRRLARLRRAPGPVVRLGLSVLVLAIAATPTGASAAPAAAEGTGASATPGALVVVTDADPETLDRIPGVDVDETSTASGRGAVLVETTAAGAAALAARPDVVAVEPDVPVAIDAGDPLHGSNWAASVLDLSTAWSRSQGDGTVVAILDTGVARQIEVDARLLPGWDVFTDSADGRGDPHGHGTKSALTVAAGRDDGYGAIGVCPRCTILPIRVLDQYGSGSLWSITLGIHAALDLGADVINISAGGATSSSPYYLREAVGRATAAGVPVVASAGNAGVTTESYPAADLGVIGVAASTPDDTRYSWSNHGSWVDVAAPGCYRVSDPVTPTTGRTYCGTSAAAPVVSGALALARAAGQPADATALRDALSATSVPVAYVSGGRLDVCPLMSGGLRAPKVTVHSPSAGGDLVDGASITLSTTDDCGLVRVRASLDGTAVAAQTLSGTRASQIDIPLAASSLTSASRTLTVTVSDVHGGSRVVDVPVSFRSTRAAPVFTDIGGTHAPAIDRLAVLGIASGCRPDRYCPDRYVTRAQMASFLVRAVDPGASLTGSAVPRFGDIGGTHADAIRTLAAAGIASGCSPDRYCPDRYVTRAQMASFLVRSLEG
jgi:hypothetical protein